MTSIKLIYGLPFVSATIHENGQDLFLENLLLDTGAGACIFKTDDLESIGSRLQRVHRVRSITGIGGQEWVVERQIEGLSIGHLTAKPFVIQTGEMDYGFPLNGIIGIDFLLQTGAIINLQKLEIR